MPRSKLPKGEPRFISRGFPLEPDTKQNLLNLLGYSGNGPAVAVAINKIEAALGIYVDGAVHIDNPPRPADYVRVFKALEGDARKLSETLYEINYHYDYELSRRGLDGNTVATALLELAEASRKARESFDGQPSKGRGENTALIETIRHLRAIFGSCFRGDADLTSGQKRLREIKFVKEALTAATIPCRGLGRLMRDPRSTSS